MRRNSKLVQNTLATGEPESRPTVSTYCDDSAEAEESSSPQQPMMNHQHAGIGMDTHHCHPNVAMSVAANSWDGLSLSSSDSERYENGAREHPVRHTHFGAGADDSHASQQDYNLQDVIDQETTDAVNRWKFLVYAALVVAAIGVGTGTYFFVSSFEQHQFENEFGHMAEQIATAASGREQSTLVLLKGLSDTLTSYGLTGDLDTNETTKWPFVTLPHFDIRSVNETLRLSQAEWVMFSPIVTQPKLKQWEQYAWDNQGWIVQDLEYRGIDTTLVNPGNISRQVYALEDVHQLNHDVNASLRIQQESQTSPHGDHNSNRRLRREADQPPVRIRRRTQSESFPNIPTIYNAKIYSPIWQIGPAPYNASIVNYDLYSNRYLQPIFDQILTCEHALYSDFFFMDYSKLSDLMVAFPQYAIDSTNQHMDDLRGGPRTLLVQPIFRDFYDGYDSRVVGFLTLKTPLEPMFSSVLPQGVEGIVVVVTSRCVHHGLRKPDEEPVLPSSYTFYLNGNRAEFAGAGDWHDPHYNNLQQSFELAALGDHEEDLYKGYHCRFDVSVYPSQTLEMAYTSAAPIWATVVICGVFLCTLLIFIVYESTVQRRQDKVLRTAKRTSAIVSSLFPDNVKDRLLQEAEKKVVEQEEHDRMAAEHAAATPGAYGPHHHSAFSTGGDSSSGNNKNHRFTPASVGAGVAGVAGSVVNLPRTVGSAITKVPLPLKKQFGEFFGPWSRQFEQFFDTSWSRQLEQFFFSYQSHEDGTGDGHGGGHGHGPVRSSTRHSPHSMPKSMGQPIADFFPEATILFADLVGFTAWSSMREPAKVFTLLETIYNAFDEIAKRRRVFKVETVGDCYVAVAGLPEPRPDHAVVMARFARDCLYTVQVLTKQLEVTLGPDTGDLGMRFGLHSGPVTAGVLRGERARFQLFGDAVNTCSRIETTGEKDKIHVSSETAERLRNAGKGHWLTFREDRVTAKGKGVLVTYWLEQRNQSQPFHSTAGNSNGGPGSVGSVGDELEFSFGDDVEAELDAASLTSPKTFSDKHARLIDWLKDVFLSFLKEVVARRQVLDIQPDTPEELSQAEDYEGWRDAYVLDKIQDSIPLADHSTSTTELGLIREQAKRLTLDPIVVQQLRQYIEAIASMYSSENPFHNFEHASHVTMAAVKMFSRIVVPYLDTYSTTAADLDNSTSFKVQHSKERYGITSDPLTQFAVVFATLIHDADHPGVPNSQLVQEKNQLAVAYTKSIAEQNSIDLAWSLLMTGTQFQELRRTIYCTQGELLRFRQIVVNIVMATDISDKELNLQRKERWNRAFARRPSNAAAEDLFQCRAILALEHLMQASDVSHAMQHWHIYSKWNRRLFQEMYKAYATGRCGNHQETSAAVNPADFWYQGELDFFDFYLLPMCKKLKDCGVFGVSSDEYLNYAQQNRQEWEVKGQEIVQEMLQEAVTAAQEEKFGRSQSEPVIPADFLPDSSHALPFGDLPSTELLRPAQSEAALGSRQRSV